MANTTIEPDRLSAMLKDLEPDLMSQVPADRAQECLGGACKDIGAATPARSR